MTSVREEGVVKFFAEDYNARKKVLLFQGRSQIVFPDAAKTNLSLAPHVPFGTANVKLTAQSYLRVYLYADAADTLDKADMKACVQIPLTLIKNATGELEEHLLSSSDVMLSTDATTVADTDIKVAEYQIPYGFCNWRIPF